MRLWRASGECLQAIQHPGCVWAVAFLPAPLGDGDLLTGCADAAGRVFSAAPDRQVGAPGRVPGRHLCWLGWCLVARSPARMLACAVRARAVLCVTRCRLTAACGATCCTRGPCLQDPEAAQALAGRLEELKAAKEAAAAAGGDGGSGGGGGSAGAVAGLPAGLKV